MRAQLTDKDCGIQAMAMALGMKYEDVVVHAPLVVRDGLSLKRMHALGRSLGVHLTLTDADLEDTESTGLLWIEYPTGAHAHLAYLHRGTLVNPADATIWTPHDYLSNHGAAGYLYTITASV